MKPALPPSYVNTPVPIACAEVDDALIVTTTVFVECMRADCEAGWAIEDTEPDPRLVARHMGCKGIESSEKARLQPAVVLHPPSTPGDTRGPKEAKAATGMRFTSHVVGRPENPR